MVGSEPFFGVNIGQPIELLCWDIDRSTGPNLRVASGITNVARISTTSLGKFGGST